MSELTPKAISGMWTGRLVDARGYEGELVLHLDAGRGSISGTVDATIGVTHESQRQRVVVKGEYDDDVARLHGVVDEQAGVEITMELDVFALAREGYGMRGRYQVGARTFSPLRDGVVAAAKDLPIPAVEVKPQLEVPRHGTGSAS